jgi:hypothetical protein
VQRLLPAYPPALLDEIPADAQRVVDVTLPPGTFSYLESIPRSLRGLFPDAGTGLPALLDRLTGGETAVYTRPGGETTLVTSPSDVTAARQAVRDLGVTGVRTATIGGQLVLSTTPGGIAAFRGGGPKLGAATGLPPRVAGLLWERGKTAAWASRDGGDATFTVRLLHRPS